ncbi:hypothetical protein ANN_07629 [Periplaneta americana]|uniref:Uncharacterized protein n=1 Tax=Periplaneta americana TaxID=6978 RepID=A0ABQ8T0N8_PERAM|nr:hypothetical protein ANN_07629 [Periplaneta americana]
MVKLIRNWKSNWLRRNCLLKEALEGEREKSSEQKKISDDRRIKIYEETKRKAENSKDWRNLGDNASEMSPGSSTESYPAFACIGLRENPGKNLNQVTCPDRDSNPGHLVSQPDALTVTPQKVKKKRAEGEQQEEESRRRTRRRRRVQKVKKKGAEGEEGSRRRRGEGEEEEEKVKEKKKGQKVKNGSEGEEKESRVKKSRDEQRLRVFENKVLRKICGAKRDEVTGEWRKLHNAELHALYSSPDIIRNIKSRRLRWAGHVVRIGEPRNTYRVLVGALKGKDLCRGGDVDGQNYDEFEDEVKPGGRVGDEDIREGGEHKGNDGHEPDENGHEDDRLWLRAKMLNVCIEMVMVVVTIIIMKINL